MKAENKQEFIKAWDSHIATLWNLWPKEDKHHDKLDKHIKQLQKLVREIADTKTFGGKA